MDRISRANVPGIRQQTQFTCMATSIAASLQALGKPFGEMEVNKVLGAEPLQGARWEEALATLQYFGCRGTLVVPATLNMIKSWTDQKLPVMIAWNPENRPWSHASVVVDVSADGMVTIMDPNIPDPNQNFRYVPSEDFHKKWGENLPEVPMIVRRPALLVTLEVDSAGRQIVASQKTPGISLEEFRSIIALARSPGEVWRTEEGNWRAMGPHGGMKSFESQEEAKTYAKGKKEEEKGPSEEEKKGIKGKLTNLFNKVKGIPDRIKGEIEKASHTVQAIVADEESRKVALSHMADKIKKAGVDVVKKIHESAKDELKEIGHSVHAVKKLFKKPPEKLNKKDKAAIYSASVYVAGAVLAAFPPGGALIAAKAVGSSFAKHIAIKSVHKFLDHAFLHYEAGESVFEGAHSIGKVLEHFAAEDASDEEKMFNILTGYVVGAMKDGISDEEMEAILQEKDPESQLDDLPSEPKPEGGKKASGGVMDKSSMVTADDMAALLKDAKFPKGVEMTVDEVAEVVGPEFKEMNQNPPDSVVKVREQMAGKTAAIEFISTDEMSSLLADDKEGRFEEGKPADPTENMSPEDAAEWWRQHGKNKDKFKGAAYDPLKYLEDGFYFAAKQAEDYFGGLIKRVQRDIEEGNLQFHPLWLKTLDAHEFMVALLKDRPYSLKTAAGTMDPDEYMSILMDFFLNGWEHNTNTASSIKYVAGILGNPALAKALVTTFEKERPDLGRAYRELPPHIRMMKSEADLENMITRVFKTVKV